MRSRTKSRTSRVALLAALALCACTLARLEPAYASPDTSIRRPDKLVILSTTDVKGKTSPCGCSIPKGGFSRRVSFADSVRSDYGQVIVVDAGGYFPEFDTHLSVARFMMPAMKDLGLAAIGVGERDLRFGLAFLQQQSVSVGLPVVSANLRDAKGKKTVFQPYVIQQVGALKVGIFGLYSPMAGLGPAKDSLSVSDPTEAAKTTIAALRKQGVNAIVLLSQLGQIESEDFAADVPGIDAVIAGRDVPWIEQGKTIGNTVIVFGGDQSMAMGRIVLTLDDKNQAAGGSGGAIALGPGVPEDPVMLKRVKTFEDAFNEEMRALEKKKLGSSSAIPEK
jgi:2',3'-cyclic-nucleotide 2'-phosphodiesterase (5'-nucleotidase family)